MSHRELIHITQKNVNSTMMINLLNYFNDIDRLPRTHIITLLSLWYVLPFNEGGHAIGLNF